MLFLLTIAFAASPPPAVIGWAKPVNPSLPSAQATVLFMVAAPEPGSDVATSHVLRNHPAYREALETWSPDGVISLSGPEATRVNLLLALAALRPYGRVIVVLDLPGVGGDFGDPVLVPYGANPDNPKTGIRVGEFLATLQGSQEWVAVVSSAIAPGMTQKGEHYIGPDANQWAAAAPEEMNLFVLSTTDVARVPHEGCMGSFGEFITPWLAKAYEAGTDLTFFAFASLAVAGGNQSPCGYMPVKQFHGSLTPQSVMLTGSGILPAAPEPIVVAPVLPVEPLKLNPLPIASFAAGGLCLAGGIWQHAVYAAGQHEASVLFSEDNMRDNFASEADAAAAAEATKSELDATGNRAIALYGCGAAGLAAGVTFAFTGTGFGLHLPF